MAINKVTVRSSDGYTYKDRDLKDKYHMAEIVADLNEGGGYVVLKDVTELPPTWRSGIPDLSRNEVRLHHHFARHC